MKRVLKKSLTTDLSPHIAIFVLIFAALFIIFMVSCNTPDHRIIIDCDTINIDSAYKPLQTNFRVRWREKYDENEYLYGLVDQDDFAYRAKSVKVLPPDTIISGTDIFDTFTEIKQQ